MRGCSINPGSLPKWKTLQPPQFLASLSERWWLCRQESSVGSSPSGKKLCRAGAGKRDICWPWRWEAGLWD